MWYYLQQVSSDAPVGALLGHLFGQSRHLIRGLGDVFGTLDQGSLIPASTTHQPRHFRHQQSHPLGCCYDVVTLCKEQRRGASKSCEQKNLDLDERLGWIHLYRCTVGNGCKERPQTVKYS